MIPANAKSRTPRKLGPEVHQREAFHRCWKHGPAFIDQRRAARREARLPDEVERIRARVVDHARGQNGQEIRIGDGEKILGRKAIGGIQNVGLAPADELLAEIGGQFALRNGCVELAHRQRGTPERAILPIQVQGPLHLLVRIEAHVERSRQSQPGQRLVRSFITKQAVVDGLAAVVGRGFGI